MTIVNNFAGFSLVTPEELAAADNDSEFGSNLNRSITGINSQYSTGVAIRNTYQDGYLNKFGASARFSTNEQRLIQNLIKESINTNGITIRYMPRWSPYTDDVFNERPESQFESGTEIDMILVAAAGFEGEGDVMTQFGMEFREEIILNVAIPRFEELYRPYQTSLYDKYSQEHAKAFERTRPLEGDLIVVPFGRSASNRSQYVPKVFEISRVTTFHDGAFFQVGDNYQYKIKAKLFELSGEDLFFNPLLQEYDLDGAVTTTMDSDLGRIQRAKDGIEFLDSETRTINITKDSDTHMDSWAKNQEIEERSQKQEIYNNDGTHMESHDLVVDDLSGRSHGGTTINNLDDI